jgi:hypothetical protein
MTFTKINIGRHLKDSSNTKRSPANNIGLAIVGLTVVNSTFVILFGICAKVGLTFCKYPTIAKPETVRNLHARKHQKFQKIKSPFDDL